MNIFSRVSDGTSVKQLATIFIISPMLLTLTVYWVTSAVIENWLWAILGVLLIQVFQAICQLIVGRLIRVFGVFLLLVNSFIGYGLAVWAALLVIPSTATITLGESIVIAWLYALIVTIIQWIFITSSGDYLLNQFIRNTKRQPRQSYKTPGFVFVQLDGVSSHLVDWQLKAGNLPNIRNLLESGEYSLEKWRTQIPSTTPASQAGLLFGNNDGIPAFRWYEREKGELVVANQVKGAKLIETRLSNGKGLLANGGVSVGNLFSGDAPQSIMVISKLGTNESSNKTMSKYSSYLSSPNGFMRLFILSIGEMIKEVYQASRQKARNITPRVNRHASYILLRAATNVFLRELQTAIVLDKMAQGVNSLYVDYLDYDEIAHHAGIARPESLDALAGLDKIVGILTQAATLTSRKYHVIFVSDHGQSQGTTFLQLNNGVSLEATLAQILDTDAIEVAVDDSETHTAVKSLASQQKQFKKLIPATDKTDVKQGPKVVVTGSGNLGNIWLTEFSDRPTEEQINKKYPQLINHLLETPGIGIVIVNTTSHGPVAISKDGRVQLNDGTIIGTNPLIGYEGSSTDELLRLQTMKNAPDIQLISSYDSSTGEVHAFEELVGNHGGIGGWQTDALLLHPSKLHIKKQFYQNGALRNSTTIHNIFVSWLKDAGHRKA